MWHVLDSTGLVVSRVSAPKSEVESFARNTQGRVIWFDGRADWFENDQPFFKGEAPTAYHKFDPITKQWVDPRTPETEWAQVRVERDRHLQASDWTQLPDVPIATKEAWTVYRQALRDITVQPDPFNIVWPVPPQ